MKRGIVSILALGALGALGTAHGQTEYTLDGSPTPLEEEIRWHMNRGRFDSARENQARSTAYTDVPDTTPPVAPHHSITLAARHHSEDMARQNIFHHETIPGSAYYNPATQPTPWDRMEAEGYSWNRAGENIAAGYGSAQAAYIGWWNSGGHRRNMYNAAMREVGNGYFYWQGSSYGRYYTMDLGNSGSAHFFTGTLFHDTNDDGTYDQNEAVPGIRVELRIQGTPHGFYDVSAAAGSFAIPIQSIPDGSRVEVVLINSTANAQPLTIPRDYDATTSPTLAPNGELLLGSFTQPNAVSNIGFRNLASPLPPVVPPLITLVRTAQGFELRWASEAGLEYSPQATSDLTTWIDLAPSPLTGTGAAMTHLIPTSASPIRIYRLYVRRP